MIPDISPILSWLENNFIILKDIFRGIEREGLRINIKGEISTIDHPKLFGSPLTHKWITTDFAESLLELVTPKTNNFDKTILLLRDIHRYVASTLKDELLWPMSVPCFMSPHQYIKIAQYGSSNLGRMKTVYREGLKNRYTVPIQLISGIHYNFSFSKKFWHCYANFKNKKYNKELISSGYLKLIRNYYRFGWIIPYLFGASPGICSSFLCNKTSDLPLKKTSSNLLYLPYATSLRLSNIGYINKKQHKLNISYNHINEYISDLKKAMNTSCIEYEHIGLKKNNNYLQLNTNLLQTENELYTLIRPKCIPKENELFSDSLMRKGIEYLEIRSIDINPFSPIGIDSIQIKFLDLFLIWCILVDSPKMFAEEFFYIRKNWDQIILDGRKPNFIFKHFNINNNNYPVSLNILGKLIFKDLKKIAKIFDMNYKNINYQYVCNTLSYYFDNPEHTLSARLLKELIKHGCNKLGLILANKHHNILIHEKLDFLTSEHFDIERDESLKRQHLIENNDQINFDTFLCNKNIC